MVSFRRCILALAILALFTGLASAQINTGGSTTGPFNCTATAANATSARAEGYAELLGDIVITCIGGTAVAPGTAVPTANITIALNNTIVTSRVFSNGLSEALLLIDEPGASGTGAAQGPGTTLPQTICASPNGAGPFGCAQTSGGTTGTYAPATTGPSAQFCTAAAPGGVCPVGSLGLTPNVFQGVVPAGSNQVVFNGIPILAPVSAGVARVFRITNIRGNASQFAGQAGGVFQGQIPILASITVNSSPAVSVTNPVQTVAFLFNGLGATSVRNQANSGTGSSATGLLQCNTAGITAGSVLRFPEGFAAAFKTRVSPTTTYSGAGTATGSTGLTNIVQNNPGTINNGSESGFVFPVTGGQAGLADFGTRLKATFSNVPTSVSLYVSTTNIPYNIGLNNNTVSTQAYYGLLNGGIPASTTNNTLAGNALAGLVTSETAGSSTLGGFLPLQSATNNSSTGVSLFGPLPVDANGTATAVWEILTASPTSQESLDFAVYYAYTGNPATNTPPTTPVGTVSLSFAPTYSSPTAGNLIPRFTPPSTSTTFLSVVLCQTTLLYPFVSNEPGFDTGLAIANTSSDPFSTKTQSGTCTLSFFGTNQGTPNTYTTPTVQPGTIWADETSSLKVGFKGYVIAVCNFQLGHGYALFSDTGIRNWATGYLPLVLPTGTSARNGQAINYGGSTTGAAGVEGTVH
jgi:hypothetical protein